MNVGGVSEERPKDKTLEVRGRPVRIHFGVDSLNAFDDGGIVYGYAMKRGYFPLSMTGRSELGVHPAEVSDESLLKVCETRAERWDEDRKLARKLINVFAVAKMADKEETRFSEIVVCGAKVFDYALSQVFFCPDDERELFFDLLEASVVKFRECPEFQTDYRGIGAAESNEVVRNRRGLEEPVKSRDLDVLADLAMELRLDAAEGSFVGIYGSARRRD